MDGRHKLLANLNAEWDHLLEKAFAAYDPASGSPVSARACGPYASGVFADKSFVELRHHFSINGYPTNTGALNLQTIGQAIAPFFAATLDRIAPQGARPLAVIVRSADIGYGLSPGVMRIRFYTTMGQVLDQANIFEGDEIHVGPISEDLREE
jgi:hypothetical protein